jgi:hypothetical protein
VAFCVEEIRRKRFRKNLVVTNKFFDSRKRELPFVDGGELLHPIINMHPLNGRRTRSAIRTGRHRNIITPLAEDGVEKCAKTLML